MSASDGERGGTGSLSPLACAALLWAAMGTGDGARGDVLASPHDGTAAFLERHWSRPLAPQGPAPAHFSPLEGALDARACGACHVRQYRDWQTSLHARAMGPGVLGQLAETTAEAPQSHQNCLRCHAPLAEQAQSLAAALAAGEVTGLEPEGDRPLHAEGLVCAGCHVRGRRWYGPPRRDGSAAVAGPPAHDGWQMAPAFEDSRFCAACHQFEPGQFSLNGKLLENTYEEWRASPYAERGITCQRCHMPDRRHVWRGIHDPDTVRAGLGVEVTDLAVERGQAQARIRITNSGAGHYLPTYVTPQIHVEAVQLDAQGRELDGTLLRYTVAREVTLNLSEERFDTRLAPLETREIDYAVTTAPAAVALRVRVRVEPDAFYRRFFEALLDGGYAQNGRALIEQALADTQASPFEVFTARFALRRTERSRSASKHRRPAHAYRDRGRPKTAPEPPG